MSHKWRRLRKDRYVDGYWCNVCGMESRTPINETCPGRPSNTQQALAKLPAVIESPSNAELADKLDRIAFLQEITSENGNGVPPVLRMAAERLRKLK